ncbi:MAG TPA: class I SAM-dependent methyltransferase [Rhizomicrobium sp.]|nr:class I SAM-dependent methyltransferase [Rhizomicrobium sp.]
MLGQALRHRFRFEEKTVETNPQPSFRHRAMHDWERRLHAGIGASWPCEEALELQALWPSVVGRVRSVEHHAGELNFDLSRAIWCLTRHLKPKALLEIGVGLGVTSRLILEALAMNRRGHLFSIDMPSTAVRKVGLAVEPRVAHRWSLVSDTTKRAMPGLLPRLGLLDLVVHTNPHPGNDMRNEIALAWSALRPGGVLVMDRIDCNGAFQFFAQGHKNYQALIADAGMHDAGGVAHSQFALVFKNWR